MGGSGNEERELKFVPAPRFDLVAVGAFEPELTLEAATTKRLHASYYDTADCRLARAGASLRYRDDDGWTVKLAGRADVALVRSELHVEGGPGDPPDEARALVSVLTRREPLRLAAVIDTVRRSFVLRDSTGEPLAEVVDDEVSVDGHGRAPTTFREVEVEFTKGASAELVEHVAHQLQQAGAGEPQHLSKIARALGPRALDAPELVEPGELDFASTPSEVLRAAIARSTARLLAHDPGVRLGGDDEDVHQARVATRRLRSDLRTFRPALDRGWDESLRDELKWLGSLLGTVRDADVLLARLEARVQDLPDDDHPGAERLLESLRRERATARDELLAAMSSDRYFDLVERLFAAARAVPVSIEGDDFDLDLGDLVVKPWKKLRDAVAELDDDPPDADLHAVRIFAKRARYAAEAVAPAVGKQAKRFASKVADLQDVLGEHQDAVVAGQWLLDHIPADDGLAAFVAGQLVQIETDAAEASRAEWPDVWRKARRRSLRRWM